MDKRTGKKKKQPKKPIATAPIASLEKLPFIAPAQTPIGHKK